MSILENIKELLAEFRARFAELARQDQVRVAELQEMRRTIARQAATLDEQTELIARQRSAIDKLNGIEPGWPIATLLGLPATASLNDVCERMATLVKEQEQQIDAAALLRTQLDQAALVIGKEKMGDGLPGFDPKQANLEQHVRTLLGILDAVGGFMAPDYQHAIRAARESVAGG